ncbi:MAG: septum formation initiator family protein [Chthoniobacter sp.]|nr:septum formation initiator family protein [Chthoniobacter sp.]
MWPFLNRVLITLIVIVCFVLGAVWFSPVIGERRKQKARLDELTLEVEKERQSLALNVATEELLRRDPEFASNIARDRLSIAGPDETIFVFPATNGSPTPLNR